MKEYPIFDRYLNYAPGMADISPRTLRYMAKPYNFPGPDFFEYYNETAELLKTLFQTRNNAIMMVGPIRVGMDASICSVVEPEDKVLVLTNGYWGDYPVEIVKAYEGRPIVLEEKAELPLSPEKVSEKLEDTKDVKAVVIMHVETDTGIVNPVEEIGELVQESGAIYIVDTATSLGGMEVNVDKWNADLCFSGSHKCMSSPADLAFITVSDKAWETIEKRKTPIRSWYTSLLTWRKLWLERKEGECPFAFPITSLHAVRAKLDCMFQEGPEKIYKKYETAGRAIRKGVIQMGLDLVPDCSKCEGCESEEKFCSDTVTVVKYPLGIRGQDFEELMNKKYNVTVETPRFGRFAGKGFRIGTINFDIQLIPRNILSILTAVGLAMTELGARVELKRGVEATNQILKGLGIP